MRIISGKARGRKLKVPKADVRPSTDRLREALFSILGASVDGARVLDLFAGSGSLGLEALSRGAASAVFVEAQRQVLPILKANLAQTGMAGRIASSDVFDFLRRETGTYDLAFADPPYLKRRGDRDFCSELLQSDNLARIVAPGGLLILENEKSAPQPASGEAWEHVDERNYGICRIDFYRRVGT